MAQFEFMRTRWHVSREKGRRDAERAKERARAGMGLLNRMYYCLRDCLGIFNAIFQFKIT